MKLFLGVHLLLAAAITTAEAAALASRHLQDEQLDCNDFLNHLADKPVCGSDGTSYKNECTVPPNVEISCYTSCAQCVKTTNDSSIISAPTTASPTITQRTNEPTFLPSASPVKSSMATTFPKLSPPASGLNPCNEVIVDIPKEEIIQTFFNLYNTAAGSENNEMSTIIKERITQLVTWNVRLYKLCTSCDEMNTLWEQNHESQGIELFPEACEQLGTGCKAYAKNAMPYCAEGKFSHGRTMSGLLMEPIDPYNNKPVAGEVATTIFPMDVTSNNPFEAAFSEMRDLSGFDINTIFPLLTASSGTYTLIPDVLGNGEDWANTRSYRVKEMYQASTIPLLLKLHYGVGKNSDKCTVLDKRVATVGYGFEGGYLAAAIAEAIDTLDDGYVHTFTAVGGAPIKTATEQLKEIVEFDNNTYPLPALIARLANAYSSTNQDLKNTNGTNFASNQYLNATDELKDVRDWIASGLSDEMILSLLPSPKASDIINPEILTPILNSYSVCTDASGKTDEIKSFCAAAIQNDLSEFLIDVEYPVVLCHSPDDKVSYYSNVEGIPEENEYTMMIENTPSFVGQVIKPNGTHEEARLQCLMGYILQFTEPGDIRTIRPPEDEACVVTYTETPTSTPSLSPTTLSATGGAIKGPTSAAVSMRSSLSTLVVTAYFFISTVRSTN